MALIAMHYRFIGLSERADECARTSGLLFAVPAVGADLRRIDADRLDHALERLIAQRVETHILADGLEQHFPRSVDASAYSSRCCWPSSPSSCCTTRRAIRSISDLLLEKFRYLQLNMMGGQAERMCTAFAPEHKGTRPFRAAAYRARWSRPRTGAPCP